MASRRRDLGAAVPRLGVQKKRFDDDVSLICICHRRPTSIAILIWDRFTMGRYAKRHRCILRVAWSAHDRLLSIEIHSSIRVLLVKRVHIIPYTHTTPLMFGKLINGIFYSYGCIALAFKVQSNNFLIPYIHITIIHFTVIVKLLGLTAEDLKANLKFQITNPYDKLLYKWLSLDVPSSLTRLSY